MQISGLSVAPRGSLVYVGRVSHREPREPAFWERPGGHHRKLSKTITRLLRDWKDGDEQAFHELIPAVYDNLRGLARRELGREGLGHSLQPTELVHDAYARMVDLELSWQDRVHFFRMAARTMRRVLVDHARARRAKKRGGGAVVVTLSDIHGSPEQLASDILDLDQALESLAAQEDRLSKAVELCYFGGLTYEEIAHALGVSTATVDRDLRFARAWLRRELAKPSRPAPRETDGEA